MYFFSKEVSILKDLRKITYGEKPVSVCKHLSDNPDLNSDVRYIATEIMDDSYFLIWCCEDCAKKYHVPYPGVFVVDEVVGTDYFGGLLVVDDLCDEDENPYKSFMDENVGYFLSREFFEKRFNPIKHEEILNSKYKIPFGKRVVSVS